MLAYSTISHVGYALLGFVTGVITGYSSAVFYILAYVLMRISTNNSKYNGNDCYRDHAAGYHLL
jgi:NADH-quinone oxidoreductase subunit N